MKKNGIFIISGIFVLILAVMLIDWSGTEKTSLLITSTPSATRSPQPITTETLNAKTATSIAIKTQNAVYQGTQSAGIHQTMTQGKVERLSVTQTFTNTQSLDELINKTDDLEERISIGQLDGYEYFDILYKFNDYYYFWGEQEETSYTTRKEDRYSAEFVLSYSMENFTEFNTSNLSSNIEPFGYTVPGKLSSVFIEKTFIGHLNNYGIALIDKNIYEANIFEFSVYEIQIDKDEEVEWLAIIRSDIFINSIVLVVDTNQKGYYSRGIIHELGEFYWCDDPPKFLMYENLDEDEENELVIVSESYIAGHVNFIFDVYDWQNYFTKVSSSSFIVKSGIIREVEELFSYDKTSISLILHHQKLEGMGCVSTRNELISISSEEEIGKYFNKTYPVTAECYIIRATRLLDEIDIESAELWLQKGLEILEDDLNKDLEAFARMRLALIYSITQRQVMAREQLELVLRNKSVAAMQFHSGIEAMIKNYFYPYKSICQTLRSVAEVENPPSSYSNYFGESNVYGIYPISYDIVADALCSVNHQMNYFSDFIDFDYTKDPTYLFDQFGYSIIRTHIQKSNFEEHNSLIVVALNSQGEIDIFASFKNENGVTLWKQIGWGIHNTHEFRHFSTDTNGDGILDLIVYDSYPPMISDCDEGSDWYEVVVTFNDENSAFQTRSSSECLPVNENKIELFLSQFEALIKGKNINLENKEEENYFVELINNMKFSSYILSESEINEIYNLESISQFTEFISIKNNLIHYRDLFIDLINLYKDFEHSIYPISNLKYLLAMSYEEEGDYCSAAQIYLELWSSEPQTIWSHLAAAHLEVVEEGQGVCVP